MHNHYINYRPNITPKEEFKILAHAQQSFDKTLSAITLPYNEIVERGKKHAEEISTPTPDNMRYVGFSDFELFLKAYYTVIGESDDDHNARLTMNYLRHTILPYEEILESTKREYWVSQFFFNDLWKAAADSIMKHYPQTAVARDNGYQAKILYSRLRMGLDDNNKLSNDIINLYMKLWDQRKEEYEELQEKAEQQEKEEWKTWTRQRSEMSRKVAPLFHNNDTINITYRGHTYEGIIIKANKVTSTVEFTLKNGKEKTRKIYNCYIYDMNEKNLPTVEGYISMKDIPQPERTTYFF